MPHLLTLWSLLQEVRWRTLCCWVQRNGVLELGARDANTCDSCDLRFAVGEVGRRGWRVIDGSSLRLTSGVEPCVRWVVARVTAELGAVGDGRLVDRRAALTFGIGAAPDLELAIFCPGFEFEGSNLMNVEDLAR